jgi:2-polyprenyl-3-methyl-5-hydroxy-6-metoxy-1,4-benzoquinol methylase
MMDQSTIRQLLEINRAFYHDLAEPFAASRSAEQPGLQGVAKRLAGADTLLDVGCGNGRLAHAVDQAGNPVDYTGIDSSSALLRIARQSAAALQHVRAEFLQVDVMQADWSSALPRSVYQAVVLLAVLQHIPGWANRRALLASLGALLAADGQIVLSAWQFLSQERLRRKIKPWALAGLDEAALEPGDYLLDWQRNGTGLRYCHLVDEAELRALAQGAGLAVQDVYYGDGADDTLNLYAVLRAG